jgi:hypothetical protein
MGNMTFYQHVCLQAASSFYRMKTSQCAVVKCVAESAGAMYQQPLIDVSPTGGSLSASNQDKLSFSGDAF